MIESNQPKKPIPPDLKPIQPGERHQSASGSGFLYWRNFSPIAARTSGEASRTSGSMPRSRSAALSSSFLLFAPG
jgi:hypothetical protein